MLYWAVKMKKQEEKHLNKFLKKLIAGGLKTHERRKYEAISY